MMFVIKAEKPYGHTAYTRRTKSGKLVNVRAKGVKPANKHAVRELTLYIENDGSLYRERFSPLFDLFRKAKERQQYNNAWARERALGHVEAAARKYNREFGTSDVVTFTTADLKAVAKEVVETWEESNQEARPALVLTSPEAQPDPYKDTRTFTNSLDITTRMLSFAENGSILKLVKVSGEVDVWNKQYSGWTDDNRHFVNTKKMLNLVRYHLDHGAGAKVTLKEAKPVEEAPDDYDDDHPDDDHPDDDYDDDHPDDDIVVPGLDKETFEAVFASPSNGLTCHVRSINTYSDYLEYDAELRDHSGKKVGIITRQFRYNEFGELSVNHQYFKIDPKYRGHGVATEIMERAEALYEKLDVKEVTVHANIDVGGYTWAKFGFDFASDSDLKYMKNKFLNALERAENAETISKKSAGKARAAIKHMKHPWAFAALVIEGHQFGKEWMLETSWYGTRRLDVPKNHPSKKVFTAYINAQKKKGKTFKKADDGDDPREGNDDVFLAVAKRLGFLTSIANRKKLVIKANKPYGHGGYTRVTKFALDLDFDKVEPVLKVAALVLPDLVKSITHEKFYTTVLTLPGQVRKVGEGRFGARQIVFQNGVKATLKLKLFSNEKFRGIDKNTQYLREAAAYQLDRQILQLNVVPPTTLTMYKGTPASVQAWVIGMSAVDMIPKLFVKNDGWQERIAKFTSKVNVDGIRKTIIFDLVANNVDRHGKNCLFDPFTKHIWAIDNGLCFGHYFRSYNNVFHRRVFTKHLKLTPDEREHLKGVTKSQLAQALQRYLTAREIEETYWRIQWVLQQADLGYKNVAPDSDTKNDFPAQKAWFADKMRKEPKNHVLAQAAKMGTPAIPSEVA